MKTNIIYSGDCLQVLKTFPDNSIDSIVTDPPYGLEFMGKDWDKFKQEKNDYYNFTFKWARECWRILKPGGFILSFGGARTYHRLACAIEDAGFEIRDMVEWVYGSGFPKSLDINKQLNKKERNKEKDFEGWGTALKPAHEPICLARKPLSEKSVVENILKWGTGGLNINAARIPIDKKKEIDNRVGTNRIRGDKRGLNSKIIFGDITKNGVQMYKEQGRFPANLIHDGSQEVLNLFPETKSANGHFNKDGYNQGNGVTNFTRGNYNGYGDNGSAARFFYCAKASKNERNEGLDNKKNTHPTVKPIALIRYLVRLITPKGGLVLDPFIGSGTTGIAALLEGMSYIGIEKEPEYIKIAEKRIQHFKNDMVKEKK